MNGDLAALVALALHGNDWLASRNGPAPQLDTANSTFQYVERVHVTCPRRGLLRTRTWAADGVAAWLQFVRNSGGRRLSLVIGGSRSPGLPDAVAASFANGVRWGLVSDGPTPRFWQAHWAVNDRDRPDRRIWAVEVSGTPLGRPRPVDAASPAARHELRAALEETREFAETCELDTWSTWFSEALDLLDAPEPVIPYHPDLAPAGLPVESRQLLAAAVAAWVFGGMGSWNDLGFPDATVQAEYDRRTGRLYASILGALAAVVDHSAR